MTPIPPTEAVREAAQSTQIAKEADRLSCPLCGYSSMRREERRGFLQKRVYLLFGHYPWRCKKCNMTSLMRKRLERRRRRPESAD